MSPTIVSGKSSKQHQELTKWEKGRQAGFTRTNNSWFGILSRLGRQLAPGHQEKIRAWFSLRILSLIEGARIRNWCTKLEIEIWVLDFQFGPDELDLACASWAWSLLPFICFTILWRNHSIHQGLHWMSSFFGMLPFSHHPLSTQAVQWICLIFDLVSIF